MSKAFKVSCLLAYAGAGLAVVLCLAPIPQDPAYHAFADRRTLFGIPHFWNVVSNLPFLLAGAFGIAGLRRARFREAWERGAWAVLLGAVLGVSFGSGYYHAAPSSAALFWDRVPMTLMFSAFLAITLGERVDPAWGRRLLAPLLAAGLGTLLYWRRADDLRFYGYLQGLAMTALPLMLLLFPPRYTRARDLWALIGLYAAAKICEALDAPIYRLTAEAMSGHALKHWIAGAAAGFLPLHLARREPLTKQTG